VENKLETWKLALSVLGEKLQNGLLKKKLEKITNWSFRVFRKFLNGPFWN